MGNNIKLIRKARGLTQKDIFLMSGIPQTRISEYEHAKNIGGMTLSTALAFANALNCSVEDIVADIPKEEYIVLACVDDQIIALNEAIANNDIDGIINNGLAR